MIDNGLEINEIENKIKRLKELVEQMDYNFMVWVKMFMIIQLGVQALLKFWNKIQS